MPELSTFSLLALLLSLAAAQSNGGVPPSETTNCTVFTWDERDPFVIGGDTPGNRVSAAQTCPDGPENRTCAITASGEQAYGSGWNLTGENLYPNYPVIYAAVLAGVDNSTLLAPTFNSNVIGSIDGVGVLEPGESGYLNFSRYDFCYSGTVSNCTEGVEDETPVEVCSVLWHYEGDEEERVKIDGVYHVQNVSEGDVDEYEDPYAGQVSNEGVAIPLSSSMGLAVLVGMGVLLVV